jgi:hypothetical protein
MTGAVPETGGSPRRIESAGTTALPELLGGRVRLVCPLDHGELQPEHDRLRCRTCSRGYDVRDGVPDMAVPAPD